MAFFVFWCAPNIPGSWLATDIHIRLHWKQKILVFFALTFKRPKHFILSANGKKIQRHIRLDLTVAEKTHCSPPKTTQGSLPLEQKNMTENYRAMMEPASFVACFYGNWIHRRLQKMMDDAIGNQPPAIVLVASVPFAWRIQMPFSFRKQPRDKSQVI